MKYSLLQTVIAYLETYEKEAQSTDIEGFVIWMNQRLFSKESIEEHSAHDDLLIAFKLIHLNRDIKKQAKGVLSNSMLGSIDEYSLLHLDHSMSFRKMEIIEMHNLEAPTGIDVIKRLLKAGLIEEFPDSEDRRAKRIRLTQAGKSELDELKPKMDALWSELVAPLKVNEKVLVSGVLDKLMRM